MAGGDVVEAPKDPLVVRLSAYVLDAGDDGCDLDLGVDGHDILLKSMGLGFSEVFLSVGLVFEVVFFKDIGVY